MIAFAWLVAIALGMAAMVYLIAAIVAAARALRPGMIAASAILTLAFVGVAFGVRNPFVVGAAALVAGFAGAAFAGRMAHSPAEGERTIKLSAAHLALVAGSLVFLIPFAWLISTSLKTDEEMAVFPPVWLPTQQVTTRAIQSAEGEPAGLSLWRRDGGTVEVAEIAGLPTGQVRVRGIGPGEYAGREFVAERRDLQKIRRFAPRWENYSEALAYLPPETFYGLRFLGNTLFLTVMTVIGTLISSSLVAYAFARLHFPGKGVLFVLLLSTMMIPGAVTMMPQFLIFRSLGWIDTLRPLWVPAFFGSAFNIFLLRQFFLSIPTELEDAAKIDGCGPFSIWWRVMLPLVKPALAAISITGVLGAWNNFQGPLIYLSSPEKMPMAYALQLYQQQYGGEPGLLMAASTLVVLPIVLLFFFTQRYFIEGISLTGLGGR
jgi:multiple sugar transport system permease protein